jgi:hypothetical protein
MAGEPNGIGIDILVPWFGDTPPLFGYGPDIPAPDDGDKPSPISFGLEEDMILLQDEGRLLLSGPHKAVTDPTNTAPGPSGTAPSDPNYTSPTDDEIDPGSDRGATMFDSGSGGGGGGGLPDIEDPGLAAD